MSHAPTAMTDSLDQMQHWFRRMRPGKLFALTLIAAAISSAVATWAVMSGGANLFGIGAGTLGTLVYINLALVLLLAGTIGYRIIGLWRAMKLGRVGTRLQTRIVLAFCLVTIIPTVLVSAFSAIFFHISVKTWFDERVQTAINQSVVVAESYLAEHKETIRADLLAMAGDLQRDLGLLSSPSILRKTLDTQAALRNLAEAVVFDASRVLARTDLSFSLEFERLPTQVMARVDAGKIVILADDEDNKIRAIVRLDDLTGTYLMIGRIIDPRVISHMIMVKGAVNQYAQLQKDIASVQLHFSALFILISLLLLLSAIWYGMYVAMRLVVPVTRLIAAAEKVRAGDFSVQVPETTKQDEVAELGRTFNRMTQQIEKQQQDLVNANHQLDERRRFTEAVFAGVSAGVLALDRAYVVMLNNRRAAEMLQDDPSQSMKGMPVMALLPGLAELLQGAAAHPDTLAEKHLSTRRGSKTLNLHVRVSVEHKASDIEGYIVTMDDITELMAAQRSAAWADVARRIAHEIKNPLTPITLSTDRLRKKYLTQLTSEEDRESFLRYVDTISRHVKDIGQMVEEFVSFARMPAAQMTKNDLNKTITEAIFSAQTAKPTMSYRYDRHGEDAPLYLVYDERHIAQVLVNILKNAAEAIETRHEKDPTAPQGLVLVRIEQKKNKLHLIIEDNGLGFPADKLHSLTEPYVTTRAKGTGLGLAIVKKHMEEHKGSLALEQRPEGGARVILIFPQQ